MAEQASVRQETAGYGIAALRNLIGFIQGSRKTVAAVIGAGVLGLWFLWTVPTAWLAYPVTLWLLPLVLGVGHLLLALTLAHQLVERGGQFNGAWRYRAAVVGSAGLALALCLIRAGSVGYNVPLLASAWVGALLGGLFATAVDKGIFEESYPPSALVCEQVYQKHLHWMALGRGEPKGKRLFDLVFASLGLILSLPVCLLYMALIWFEEPGPIFFVKHSVGRGGRNFRQLKFRTMKLHAERDTGPIPALKEDHRILWTGKFLRKTASDELPQLVNVLRGEMSFVGPRPLRTVVVHEYLARLPEFAERHTIHPGIAGLAQVRGGYYVTPLQRLRFDRLYIRHMSLDLDLWILGAAIVITLMRWKPGLKRAPDTRNN